MEQPDFFLASTEGYGLEAPCSCWAVKRVANEKRNDLLLARIHPPLAGQRYGGDRDIEFVLIAPRHEGGSLFPINEWPLYVHVARPIVNDPIDHEVFRSDEYELLAWAELYPTEEEARLKQV